MVFVLVQVMKAAKAQQSAGHWRFGNVPTKVEPLPMMGATVSVEARWKEPLPRMKVKVWLEAQH